MRLKSVLPMTIRTGNLIMTEFECLRLGMITFKRDFESTRTCNFQRPVLFARGLVCSALTLTNIPQPED